MYTQKDKQKRGSQFESEFRASINNTGCWCHKIITGFKGTPFDYFVVNRDGIAIGVELKRTVSNRLNYSQIRDNQRIGLTEIWNKNGLSVIVCNVKNKHENKCYWIPWYLVMDDVSSGRRGSIEVTKFMEAPRIKLKSGKYGWDFNRFL